ncbi:MAG: MBL fold metallo-hydrolase [Candidatus Lindowbacteria bacterium]|nr:MBL fold metallo-hydrolase [Candidatus Lindowbacteria bacterium]
MSKSLSSHGIGLRMLASGSSGNSILLSSERFHFLIDAGLSCRELLRRLEQVGLGPNDISAVIVTHEHQDHIRGVGVLSRQHEIPIYMNASTLKRARSYVGEIPTAQTFATGDALALGDLTVQTYPVPHDAADPIGLSVQNSVSRIGIALDMGYPTKLVKHRLRDSNALVLEFNHDPEMLRQLMHDQLHAIVLAHISREANSQHHARSIVEERLRELGRADIDVFAGDQDMIGDRIEI